MTDEGSTSLRRAIAILTALASPAGTSPSGAGVSKIARLVGREKSQVSRTLRTLAGAGLVDRDEETLGYRLGWQLFALAARAGDQHLLATAAPVLRHLVTLLNERVHLTVRQADAVLTVLSENPSKTIQAAGWVGRTTPLHCTSSGRALLFDHSDDDVRGLLCGVDFASDGPNAPRDIEDFLSRLHQARRHGFALADEEFEPGLVAAAAPVRDFRGRTVAALNVSAPKFRLGCGLLAAGHQVKLAAEHLSGVQAFPDHTIGIDARSIS
ncbi:MAG: IclR family transcriptional regulator [Kutzneria sp.]|nr:IclR family transcriptional regulator [Kutzneria sp.]